MLSALHPSSQPPPLLDSNPSISNLSISSVPHSSQPENVSSSQSHLSNLLYSFTCSSCKLHKRLAVVKCRKCSSFFHLRCVKLSGVQALIIGSNWSCPYCSDIDHIPASVQTDQHLHDEALSKYLQDLKLNSCIIRRIPKEARVVFAVSLVQLIESILSDPVSDINPDQIPTAPIMTESSVRKAILSFPNGLDSGPDLLRPQHLKDIISPSLGASANSVLLSIPRFASFVSSTKISDPIRHLFFGAHLYALQKKDDGIRPIAVGNKFRRLFSKLSVHSVINSLREDFLPCQLGVGVRMGCESAVHATRSFINHSVDPKALLKLDVSNAFNPIDRKTFIGEIATRYPSLYFLVNEAYSNPSTLFAGEHRIPSSRGIQQGDPLGPALFALAVDKIAKDMSSELNIWYLDDATIGGQAISV